MQAVIACVGMLIIMIVLVWNFRSGFSPNVAAGQSSSNKTG